MATWARLNRKNGHDLAAFGVRVLADAHMTWIAAEVESEHALHNWLDDAARRDAAAYTAYCAAIDREEAAARDLARLCQLIRPHQERLAPS